MKLLGVVCFAFLVTVTVAGCHNAPGANGRYAHGYEYLYRAGGARWAP